MLEGSNLGKIEQLLVLTSVGNDRKFDNIAKAMLEQHALVHVEEKSTKRHDTHRQPYHGVMASGEDQMAIGD